MIPKEKAKELYDKYFELVEAYSSVQQEDNARKAALIAVDEIISLVGRYSNYWQEVKQEIRHL